MYPSQPPQEVVLYQDGYVTVTTGRFTVGGNMYPIRNITAVSATEWHQPPSRAGAVWAILAGFGFAFLGLGFIALSEPDKAIALFVTAALCFGIGVLLWRSGRWAHCYIVQIATGGMQQNAVQTANKEQRDAILAALHRASSGY